MVWSAPGRLSRADTAGYCSPFLLRYWESLCFLLAHAVFPAALSALRRARWGRSWRVGCSLRGFSCRGAWAPGCRGFRCFLSALRPQANSVGLPAADGRLRGLPLLPVRSWPPDGELRGLRCCEPRRHCHAGSSQARDQTDVPGTARQVLNRRWTTTGFPFTEP